MSLKSKITYEDKVNIITNHDIAKRNKVTDKDMNEIKHVVNNLVDNSVEQDTKIDLNFESIEELKQENKKLKEQVIEDREDIEALSYKSQKRGQEMYLNDSSNATCDVKIEGNDYQEVTENRPSTEFPSEIKTVGNDTNLFDKNDTNLIRDGIAIGGTGNITSGNGNSTVVMQIAANQEITISRLADTRFRIGTSATEITSGTLDNYTANDTSDTIKITTNSVAKYLYINFITSTSILTKQAILDSLIVKNNQKSITITVANKNVVDVEDFTMNANSSGQTFKELFEIDVKKGDKLFFSYNVDKTTNTSTRNTPYYRVNRSKQGRTVGNGEL